MANGLRCDIEKLGPAAKDAIDAALKAATRTCANPIVLSARILSIEPTACRTWNAGFRSVAEIEFDCGR
jgi:hypothetical protein